MKRQTRIAQYVSLGVGILSILVALVLANGEIKSAYEWFNAFMGLVLGVLGGTFALGAFTKRSTKNSAYAAFIVAALLIVFIKYNPLNIAALNQISSWSYALISISVSLIVGFVYSAIERKITGKNIEAKPETTIYYKSQS